jgi:hypothetical protein
MSRYYIMLLYHVSPRRGWTPSFNFQQRAMQREGLARDPAEMECESSVLVCMGMHCLLLLTVSQAAKHPWPRTRDDLGVCLPHFV